MTRSGGMDTMEVGNSVEVMMVDMADTCPRATAGMVVDMVTTLVMDTVAVAEDMEDMVLVVDTVAEDMEGTVVVVDTVAEDTWEVDITEFGVDSSTYKDNYFHKV
jgi:division protein CdvB (Snf7/Vps24/ESCRT-III family)